jgi:pimeloyl-ACP methyl ester carboxylesterase
LNVATDEKFAHVEELQKMLRDWSKLSMPVTVVQGGSDDIVDPANFEFAKKQLQGKNAEFIYLPHAGHLIRWQHPAMVRSILLKGQEGANSH